MAESLIVRVIRKYYPDWVAPTNHGSQWVSALCPFHDESNPSGSVSYDLGGFVCFSCGYKADAIGIIMREEGMGYLEAVEVAKGLSPDGYDPVRGQPAGKSGRRSFGEQGPSVRVDNKQGGKVQAGIRRRPFAGS